MKCEKFTDDRRRTPSDGNTGELKTFEKSENIQTYVKYPTCVIKLLTQGSRYRVILAKKSPCEG